MQTITIPAHDVDVYSYDELPEDVKERIREEFLISSVPFFDDTTWEDVRDTATKYGVNHWSYNYGYADVVGGMRYFEPGDFPEPCTWSDMAFMDVFDAHMPALIRGNDIADRLDTDAGYQKLFELYDRLAEEAMQRLCDAAEADSEYHSSRKFIDEWMRDEGNLYTADGQVYEGAA